MNCKLLIVVLLAAHSHSFFLHRKAKSIEFDAERDTQFELFSRASPHYSNMSLTEIDSANRYLTVDNSIFETTNSVNFDPRRPTRIFVHGFCSNRDTLEMYAKAYLNAGDFNYIGVNWLKGADTLDYKEAALIRVRAVGRVLARFIDHLVGMDMNPNDLIIVGHSLGAHICGFAGKYVTKGPVGTIIGLDPAKPLFPVMSHSEERLHYTDAKYVQIIHTSGGFLGIKHPIGHADFYPNYGCHQPGCSGFINTQICSHTRVHDLFVESLKIPFVAKRCSTVEEIFDGDCEDTGDRVIMGGDMENMGKAYGLFYLRTSDSAPFVESIAGK